MSAPAGSASGIGAADDSAKMAALPQRIVDAWARYDADAFAEVFAEDGSMILPGVYLKGREEIRSHMAKAFDGPYRGTRVTGQPMDLRVLGSDTALILTQGGVLGPGETAVSDARAIRASWLVQRRDGQWQLVAYQNTPRDAS